MGRLVTINMQHYKFSALNVRVLDVKALYNKMPPHMSRTLSPSEDEGQQVLDHFQTFVAPTICQPLWHQPWWDTSAGACFGVSVGGPDHQYRELYSADESDAALTGNQDIRVNVVLVMGPAYDALALEGR